MPTTIFNTISKTDAQKNEDACRVLAQWWADQLPGADAFASLKRTPNFDCSRMDDVHLLVAEVRAKHSVTSNQYFAFRDALFDELKKRQPEDFKKYIRVSTYFDDISLKNALQRACIVNGNLALPMGLNTYIQHDRQVIVPSKDGKSIQILPHESQPESPHKSFSSINSTKWQYYRPEYQYLVVDLEPGQEVATMMPVRDGPKTSFQKAAAGEVLVIDKVNNHDFAALKKGDWASLFNPDKVEWSRLQKREDYPAEEKTEYGQTLQRMDDEGHYRTLGAPIQAQKVMTAFSTGYGSTYHAYQPDDYIFQERPGTDFSKITKESLENGAAVLLPSKVDGTLIDPSQVQVAATKRPETAAPSLLNRLKFWRQH